MSLSETLRRAAYRWLLRHVQYVRKPDIYIGGRAKPYLLRWYVIPRNPLFNVYYHKFMRSDLAEALHDHPWLFNASWLLDGTYREHTFTKPVDRKNRVAFYQRALPARRMPELGIDEPASPEIERLRALPETKVDVVKRGTFKWRWGKSPHRVELYKFADSDVDIPVTTLFITGPRLPGLAKWGFYCRKGWKHWQQYLHTYGADHSSVENKRCD